MPRAFLCSECVSAGVVLDNDVDVGVGNLLVSCASCGAVDEQATYTRNAVDVHSTFGTLMNEGGTSNIQFKEYAEKKHEASNDFIDQLLNVYLVEPTSRLTERRADHFKAGVKTWYNRYRQAEQARRQFKWGASTNNDALKVRYILAVAIHITILESNIMVINNRIAHLKPVSRHSVPAARGDGTIMAPSLPRIFARAHALGPTHIGYLDSLGVLRNTLAEFKKLRDPAPSPLEVTLAHTYVLAQRLQFLARLPHAARLQHLLCKDLKPAAQRAHKTPETAQPDDFTLGSNEWDYIAKVDWTRTFEMAYHLYCAQQVVSLWGIRCTIDMGVALLQWAIMATVGTVIPALTAFTKEMAMPYGGSEIISSRRREELKVMLVGWSTSFPDAGIPIPILKAPRTGTMGNGLRGYASDKRRPIPEYTMAIAAAPVVAAHWRLIMEARLRTRTRALPLDDEFTAAALMFARAYAEDFDRRKNQAKEDKAAAKVALKQAKIAQRQARKEAKREAKLAEREAKRQERLAAQLAKHAASAPTSKRGSRASSSASSAPAPGASRALSQHAARRGLPPAPIPSQPPKSPTLEALLATREDSSDDDRDGDSEDDEPGPARHNLPSGDLGLSGVPSVPFEFSIGPNGFSVAMDNSTQTTVPVGQPPRGTNTSKRSAISMLSESITSDEPLPKKRKGRRPAVPMSPPPTSPSTLALSEVTRRSQPSLSPATDATGHPIQASSPTPSLRSITMSPSLTAISTVEPSQDSSTAHVGLLARERDQYAFYNVYNDQRSGIVVSPEIEKAMNAWLTTAKATGVIPTLITRQYLERLGFYGNVRVDDLGPFIRDNPQWSPTECLLRLGIRPVEFPPNLVVHSLLDLEQQLGGFKWEDRLVPIGHAVNDTQLVEELDTLFQFGTEHWQDLFATPAEADKKEALYLKSKVWSYKRDVPEGNINRLDRDSKWYKVPRDRVLEPAARTTVGTTGKTSKASKRIDYSVFNRLVWRDGDGGDAATDDEGEGVLIEEVVHETLWSALGSDPMVATPGDDDECDDGENDDDEDDYNDDFAGPSSR